MNKDRIERLGNELYNALLNKKTLPPLTRREPDISIQDAYQISLHMVERRIAAGERIIGKKIGVSSKAVQEMLNVHQPDFGYLTDGMLFDNGCEMPIGEQLIQPRAEGELAFILNQDLQGPGITEQDVLAATASVVPCFEIVDSRIEDWKIKIEDTVADNASCGLFVLGTPKVSPNGIDLSAAKMTVHKNGHVLSEGFGSAALGSPLTCVAWLANTLGEFGVSLKKGEIILSGSWVPLEPVVPGDSMKLIIDGIGTAELQFC